MRRALKANLNQQLTMTETHNTSHWPRRVIGYEVRRDEAVICFQLAQDKIALPDARAVCERYAATIGGTVEPIYANSR